MTYRELVKICNDTTDCVRCKHRKECEAFYDGTGFNKIKVEFPCDLYEVLYSEFDFDSEIEVEE